MFEFDFKTPNEVVPFELKEKIGYEEAKEYTKQTLLVYTDGFDVIKSFIVRYSYFGSGNLEENLHSINYDKLSKNWYGDISVYSLNESHIISFEIFDSHVNASKTYEVADNSNDIPSSAFSSSSCTTYWSPGPCFYIEGGIQCNDTFTTYCSNINPPLYLGYPIGNGGGGGNPGSGGGSGDASLCDFDPDCVSEPGGGFNPQLIEGYFDPFETFELNPNPGVMDWTNSSSSQRLLHFLSHVKIAKLNNVNLNVLDIFTNFPSDIQAGGPVKRGIANLIIQGTPVKLDFNLPVSPEWSLIKPYAHPVNTQHSTIYHCRFDYYRADSNGYGLRSAYISSYDLIACNFLDNELL